MSTAALLIIIAACVLAMTAGVWATFWRDQAWGALLYFSAALVLAVSCAWLVGRLVT